MYECASVRVYNLSNSVFIRLKTNITKALEISEVAETLLSKQSVITKNIYYIEVIKIKAYSQFNRLRFSATFIW